jgi:hypothetical protein
LRAINARTGAVVAANVRQAESFLSRLRGLIGSKPLAAGEALLLVGESSIHTFLMGFPIDVAYLDSRGVVLRIDERMPPYRLGPIVRGTKRVLEMAPGAVSGLDLRVGDRIDFGP